MSAQHLVATVEQIRNDLAQIPEMDNAHRRISTRDAIRSLSEEIRGLQRRGHSFDSIARLLTEKGIDIKPNTLKMYLRKRTSRRQTTPEAPAGPLVREASSSAAFAAAALLPAPAAAIRAVK